MQPDPGKDLPQQQDAENTDCRVDDLSYTHCRLYGLQLIELASDVHWRKNIKMRIAATEKFKTFDQRYVYSFGF
jgi:hypothetical protein